MAVEARDGTRDEVSAGAPARAGAPTSGAAGPPTPSLAPPPTRPPAVGGIVLGIVLVVGGGLWLLASLGVDVPVGVVTPVVLVALGVAIVVSAVRGEDDGLVGLAVFVGVWVTIASLVTLFVGVPLTGGVGDRVATPSTVTEVADGYRSFAGTQTLDLRALDLRSPGPADGTLEVEVSTLLGEVEVLVPSGMAVRVDAAGGAGTLDLAGSVVDGVGLRDDHETAGWADAARRVDLRLRVGLGEVRLRTDPTGADAG